jgi:hypothetical protein
MTIVGGFADHHPAKAELGGRLTTALGQSLLNATPQNQA